MTSTETFGLFLLPLTTNKGHINEILAKRVMAIRTRYLELKKERPERHAIRNLLGVLAFRLGQLEKALEHLNKILSDGEDPNNLNALANKKYVCEKLFMFPEAQQCEQRISELLQDDEGGSSGRCRKLRARSLAEQAFAYSFEPFEESVTFQRYSKSVALYQEATELAGDVISQDEKEDWLFASGMASYTIYTRIRRGGSRQEDSKARFQQAVDKFVQIVQTSEDNILLSDSWRHLGELFEKYRDHAHAHLPVVPDNFQMYVRCPKKCFQEALAASPDNPRIIARYADYLQGNSPSKALDLLNHSIEKDPTVFNIRAYYIRARICMGQYKQKGERSLLEKAEKDLEVTFQYSHTPWHLELMAEVFYLKAKDPHFTESPLDVQNNLQKALIFCAKAVACQDGQNRPDVHKLRGECLCALGQHRVALGCFKRAVECESAARLYRGSADSLALEYEHILRSTPSPIPPDSPLLADMVYWLHQAAQLCLSNHKTLKSLSKLQELPRHWIRFVMYCHDNKHIQKYESIKLAASNQDKSNRRHRSLQRQMSCLDLTEDLNLQGLSMKNRRKSFPGTGDSQAQLRCNSKAPAEDNRQLRVASAPSSQEESSSGREATAADRDGTTSMSNDSVHVDLTDMLPSSVESGDDAKESDTFTLTFARNRKTGKIERIITSPSPPDTTTDDVSSKHVSPPPERPLNQKLPYDFFVIYADTAEEWVLHHLIQELEDSGLKGCFRDRDFPLGRYKLAVYPEFIQSSVCTIIVITADFEKSKDQYSAMAMALELETPVIPLLRDKMDMPIALRGRTHLKAYGAVDWAWLQRDIEQKVTEVNSDAT
ncbi:tetratricopeptide repeat protein 22-like [Patiria miniata]|uniref:TIR domain-containing protein n=1 Tax=Patiria miniata TaxID=46514 RepID=A0A913Z3W5_PATMI|nr:tetratricopeptide repeat protein 22-like [Patiria miniata]